MHYLRWHESHPSVFECAAVTLDSGSGLDTSIRKNAKKLILDVFKAIIVFSGSQWI